ncbi:hypothetical protein [Nocardioides ungokensis]|uniref:hypothetical protein n=1 Tax=Nocardioides ungokensis TaxID=1643322 RepID=UPI0015DF91AA|nr:hypothetical protein [Nocardioides ungokensis]
MPGTTYAPHTDTRDVDTRDDTAARTRHLRALGRQIDTRLGTFPFDHARLAWLESYGDVDR